ncbi:gamma-glutamyl-gamma-aminobutyrate hydrolase family protein [Rhodanobacter sp. FDAARGOS 1247]|uniref:gamma-glutamyl-gamma-aminobutyrate hydrolase family protein n=1 Tax=Rhodanobacter sp. FDAARGOS 1247 TaxID=2778082 RepID=UPI0019512DA2|nr:gamma-glutamyl-gamma-aminobutyrate hydrolase family protein [Rhodanobacter sp. FDAARGOS 1247]QRP62626.1 gamma-glutamyl-gamma-aminobutyrate hydrolase family protein [Rhodanobacter sp. FDAARGOS 1247]
MVDAKFQKSSVRVANEISQLKAQQHVAKARELLEHSGLARTVKKESSLPTVRIGVCFRTDGGGAVHGDHDVKGLLAINDLIPGPGCRVVCVPLPAGASGPVTPNRDAFCSFNELDGIDLLYIPGAPAAPASQSATSQHLDRSSEERNFNRKLDPGPDRPGGRKAGAAYDKALREFTEAASRAPYEARLLDIARVRGIPVLAICAGSWRLLESYGGKVRTLPLAERGKHKSVSTQASDVWGLSHGVRISPETMVGDRGGKLSGINSTHWAVACIRYNAKRNDFGLAPVDPSAVDPDKMLEISAFCDDPLSATVEAFETRFGAPQIGIQWHPETYMPGMPGQAQGSVGGRIHAQRLFLFIVGAALTAQQRRAGIAKALDREARAFAVIGNAVREADRGDFEAAGRLVKAVITQFSRDLWSGRMELTADAIRLIAESHDLDREGKPVGAGNLYREALSKLSAAGVRI